ncbi:myeloid-associated differentiation marker-like [Apodemus sylvaticus]|uniref:myeloid-associated differentiation marker-like n=1 Tax=Apodemus sylvaticus TaxID=10129 RepID=UPI00224446E6|nr:myeloid-associated differentiation marker-like [Apodemus sylvaticus]
MADMPATVTHTTFTKSLSPGLDSLIIVASPRALIKPLGLLRLLQLSSTGMAFLLVVYMGAWMGPMGSWCLFSWCFSFAMTLIVLAVELAGLQRRLPLSWQDFPITCACYAVLFCLSSSVIYPITYVRFMSHDHVRNYAVCAIIFSCISCVSYATEVTWTHSRPGDIAGYMASTTGMLKVFESFVACIIFLFLNNPQLYRQEPALEWCLAVYIICFILTVVVILLYLGKCTSILPIPVPTFLTGMSFLCVLLYTTVIVLWPLYKFNEGFHGVPHRDMDSSCNYKHAHSVCAWDRQLAVTFLTGVNLLAYTADFMNSS